MFPNSLLIVAYVVHVLFLKIFFNCNTIINVIIFSFFITLGVKGKQITISFRYMSDSNKA